LTLAHSRPFSIGFIGYNGGFVKGEIEFEPEAYLKFQTGVNAIIAMLIWFGGALLTAKSVPPAATFAYNVIAIIIVSLLYGFLNINFEPGKKGRKR